MLTLPYGKDGNGKVKDRRSLQNVWYRRQKFVRGSKSNCLNSEVTQINRTHSPEDIQIRAKIAVDRMLDVTP